MKTKTIHSLREIEDVDYFIHHYGLRSYNLWKLKQKSDELGFKIPNSVFISSDMSIELLKQFNYSQVLLGESSDYLKPNPLVVQNYYDYLFENKKELIDVAKLVDHGMSPIIRGTSCEEGYNNLSFAGVCHSSIPKKDLSFGENVIKGTAKVLASVLSPYAQYYFSSHNIPESGKNVGIIMMKMLENPIFHATAYVYDSEIRVKYFFTPKTGTIYTGGGDIVFRYDENDDLLNKEFGVYKEVWVRSISILRKLPSLVCNDNPADIEFLITNDGSNFDLNIVQIRQLSDSHLRNYKSSKIITPLFVSSNNEMFIKKSHLYHSVFDRITEISTSKVFQPGTSKYIQTFVVNHDLGQGLFSFIDSLPNGLNNKIGLIVSHPAERSHDHLQYSAYEDERIEFLVHVNEKLTSRLKNGMLVHMISDGNVAVIKENDFVFDNIHINIVDENSLPDKNIISAVFLIGFIGNDIISVRNERGWDIPGGHVEETDTDLIDSLRREVDEEGGATFVGARPFATMQFKGKDKLMLFYVSRDCDLGEFVPKEDAFERALMNIPEFISKYNWRKDIVELLIKKSLEVK